LDQPHPALASFRCLPRPKQWKGQGAGRGKGALAGVLIRHPLSPLRPTTPPPPDPGGGGEQHRGADGPHQGQAGLHRQRLRRRHQGPSPFCLPSPGHTPQQTPAPTGWHSQVPQFGKARGSWCTLFLFLFLLPVFSTLSFECSGNPRFFPFLSRTPGTVETLGCECAI